MDIIKQAIEQLKLEVVCIDIAIDRLEKYAKSRGLFPEKQIRVKQTLQLEDGNGKRSVAHQ